MPDDTVTVSDAPAIPGLTFRRFRGEGDYPGMFAVLVAHAVADDVGYPGAVSELAARYANLTNCDPHQDMILAEVVGQLVGYSRGSWWDDAATGRIYEMNGFLLPEWRRRRIGGAMLRWTEARLRDVASTHPADLPKHFHVHAAQSQVGAAVMLERAGYQPVRYFFEMVRSLTGEIPEAPLPDGLDVRPALAEHYQEIWTQGDETSRDEWGYVPTTEEDFRAWLADDTRFQPHLWQIAWEIATDRVVGSLLTYVNHIENAQFDRKRGYTEGLGVVRDWRRRGVAKALISLSLKAQTAEGMTESALHVDGDNASNATRLYEDCGFVVVSRNASYRKPL